MGRRLIEYRPTWLDKHFEKELESQEKAARAKCLELLADLMADLSACRHPLTDPNLRRWKPSPYNGVVKITGGRLAEYRLTKTMRVIICYSDDRPEFLMIVATIKHDHARMKRVIREHGSNFSSYA